MPNSLNDSSAQDLTLLVRDKYDGDTSMVTDDDKRRLLEGEPLAYVIGWIPFLGLRIYLDSRPLIPRPETEWWTELLTTRLRERFSDSPFSFLDLCAGSGAIGLAILKAFPSAHVSFGEIELAHCALIEKNIHANGLDGARADIRQSDLFSSFDTDARYDGIATNPPYIPSGRLLPESVTRYEPSEALYSGTKGLSHIETIVAQAPAHLQDNGELWIECDVTNAEETRALCARGKFTKVELRTDLSDRPRLVVAYL